MAKKVRSGTEGSRSIVWMFLLTAGCLAALMPAASLLLLILLGPTIVALMLDRQPGRPVTRAVFLCGLAASIDPLRLFVDMDATSVDGALALLGDRHAIEIAWSAAAGGWLLSQLIPIGLRSILEIDSVSRVAYLRAEREKLASEWGLEHPPDHEALDASAIAPPRP